MFEDASLYLTSTLSHVENALAMHEKKYAMVATINAHHSETDMIHALNAGELFYCGRLGVPMDRERSAKCYVDGIASEQWRLALQSMDSTWRTVAISLLVNASEVAIGEYRASSRAMEYVHGIFEELRTLDNPTNIILAARIIAGFHSAISYWRKSKEQLPKQGNKNEHNNRRTKAIKRYKLVLRDASRLGERNDNPNSVENIAHGFADTACENLLSLQGVTSLEHVHALKRELRLGHSEGASREIAKHASMASERDGVARYVEYQGPARKLHPFDGVNVPIVCANPRCCKVEKTTMKCCGTTKYCSNTCQREHWPTHKLECMRHDDERKTRKDTICEPEPNAILVGTIVQLTQLQAREYNGQRGVVLAWAQQSRRWRVRLESKNIKNIRAHNLLVRSTP